MYCPVFRNHNSVPHLLAKLCYIVSISNRQIFSTSFLTCASGCIRLCLLLSLVAQENTAVQAPSCWRGCFLSNLRRARNSWGIDADKGAAEKIGEGSLLLLGGFSSLYLSQPQQLVGSPSSSSSYSSSSSSCSGELSTHGRAHICPHNSQ